MINKIVDSAAEALHDVESGSVIAIGGFCGPGDTPSVLIRALAERKLEGLTVIANDLGRSKTFFDRLRVEYERGEDPDGRARLAIPLDFHPPAYLVDQGQVKKVITSMASQMRPSFEGQLEILARRGEVDVELVGQGTLAERLRAARAGIAAFYSPVGAGTLTANGKEVRLFDGVPHVLEHALRADFALVTASRADRFGNLTYTGTTRTINAVMAGSARVTIAEVDEIVPLGALDPDAIVTPGVYVDRVVGRTRAGECADGIAWEGQAGRALL